MTKTADRLVVMGGKVTVDLYFDVALFPKCDGAQDHYAWRIHGDTALDAWSECHTSLGSAETEARDELARARP